MSDALQALEQGLSIAAQQGNVEAARAITAEMQRLLKEVNPTVNAPPDLGAEAAKNLAKETGAGEAALVAAGRATDKVKAGVEEAYRALPNYPLTADLNKRGSEALAADQKTKDAIFAPLQREHPFATAGGEAAPYLATSTMGVLPAAATVGLIDAAKYGTPSERAQRGLIGAGSTFAGGLASHAGAGLISPVTSKTAGPTAQGALEAAERVGVKPTLGEATGQPWIRRLEDLVSRLPGGGATMAEHQAGNATALNRAATRAIGEDADELSPAVFAAAHKRIGKVFDDVRALPGHPISLGQDVATAADNVLRQQTKMLPTQQDQNLIRIATEAKNAAASRGRIDGETYQLTRSGLSDAAFDATGTNKKLYGDLLKALDGSADASLRAGGKGDLADALKTAREQYGNLMTLEKGATAEGGNVSAAKVASTLRTNSPGAFRQGKFLGSDMGDIAAVGEGMKPLRAGSPTFERETLANPLTAGLHYLWSKPAAAVLTSPAATLYPRTLGKTQAARLLSKVADPSGRAAIAAALQQTPLLSPVMAEQ